MAERSIVVRLRAEVNDFKRGMAEAAQAVGGVTSSTPKAETALGRMVQSAQRNREAWETTGRTLTGVGLAITGIGAAALSTGIQYNTLQQTSRAALTTLTGSAEAANAQMDKLDDFARNSPFAKQVFITAQQQMLGFGIEAGKVIPYLDAIQNAVAATGGSNQEIADLSRIFSTISASAKITAEDLNQFGERGVDAATLIGTQMGMTGAQVRESITAGTLDARAALDALAVAMQDRFGGAADNVKNTFEGSIDRVKAAWRDLASELATPLVDPNGGGGLIDLANGLADAMRGFQGLPEGIKTTALLLTGTVGAASLAAGSFLLLAPRVMDTVAAYQSLSKAHPALIGNLGRGARAVGIAAAGFIALQAAGELLSRTVDEVALGTNELRAALGDLSDEGPGLESLFSGLSTWTDPDWLQAEIGAVDEFRMNLEMLTNPNFIQRAQSSLLGLFPGDLSQIDRYGARLGQIGDELGSMAQSDLPRATEAFSALYDAAGGTDEAGRQLLETMPALRDALVGVATEAGLATDDTTLLGIATGELVPVVEEATEVTQQATAAQEEAAAALQGWRDMVAEASGSFIDLMGGYQGVIDQNRAMAEATAEATDDAEDSWEDYYDGFSVAAGDWIASLEEQVTAQQEWADNITALSDRVNETMTGGMRRTANEMIDELLALGPEGAAAVATMRDMSDDELAQMVEVYRQKGAASASAVTREIEGHRAPRMKDVILQADTAFALGQIDQFIRSQSGRVITVDVQGRTIGVSSGSGNMVARASGGSVFGPGSETSDSIPALLSNNEHVWSAREVKGAGGHAAVENLRSMARQGALPGFAGGGRVGYIAPGHMSAAPSGVGAGAPAAMAFPDTVRLDSASVREVASAIVAGAHEVSSGVVAGVQRSAAGTRSTAGRTY